MEDKELQKINERKENIKKYIDRLYNTTSVNAETNTTEELVKEAKKLGMEELANLANELDVFGKCVLHYRLPIDFRLDINFSKATEVIESERKLYWKEYKQKLAEKKLNPEEEYNKIILMACTLHVPIKDEEPTSDNGVPENTTSNELTFDSQTNATVTDQTNP